METNKNNQPSGINFKSQIIVPLIFVVTTVVAILFATSKSFTEDLNPFIIWFYFTIVIGYLVVAIIEAIKSKEKSGKTKKFIYVMSVLSAISAILYIVFYLIFK